MNNKTHDETLISIDYGATNIGLAIGRNGIATPLGNIFEKSTEAAIHEITRHALENKVTKFIVGLPLDAEGKETKQSLVIRKFSKLLKVLSKKQIVFQPEYGTSQEALLESIAMGVPKEKRKRNDDIAAAIILRNYYEVLNEKTKK